MRNSSARVQRDAALRGVLLLLPAWHTAPVVHAQADELPARGPPSHLCTLTRSHILPHPPCFVVLFVRGFVCVRTHPRAIQVCTLAFIYRHNARCTILTRQQTRMRAFMRMACNPYGLRARAHFGRRSGFGRHPGPHFFCCAHSFVRRSRRRHPAAQLPAPFARAVQHHTRTYWFVASDSVLIKHTTFSHHHV